MPRRPDGFPGGGNFSAIINEEEALQFRESLRKKAIRLETRINPASSQKTL
jgi:hypothetical protein